MLSQVDIATSISSSVQLSPPHSTKKTWLAFFVFFLSIFVISNSGMDESEGTAHYHLAEHLVRTGQLSFADKQEWSWFMKGPGDRFYCAHEIGNTAFSLPAALLCVTADELTKHRNSASVKKRLISFVLAMQASLYSALTILFFGLLITEAFKKPLRETFLLCCVLAFTTFFWGYSRILFDGVLCSLFLTAALYYLVKYRTTNKLHFASAAFTLIGLGICTRLTMVLSLMAAIGFFFAFEPTWKMRVKVATRAVIALAPFLIWQLWYNHFRTGNIFTAPIIGVNPMGGNPLNGLFGLLLSPGKGLFFYAPCAALSLAFIPMLWRGDKALALFCGILTGLWFGIHANLPGWWGQWGWGPRYLITILPIMMIPFAFYARQFTQQSKLACMTVYSLVAAGFVCALSSIIVDFGFRITYLEATNVSEQELIWSITRNQYFDAIQSSFNNFERLLTHETFVTLKGTNLPESAWPMAIQHASGTLNIWPFTAIYVGVPPLLVAGLIFPVVLAASLSFYHLRKTWLASPQSIGSLHE